MLDKNVERKRSQCVVRGFGPALADLGFACSTPQSCVRQFGEHSAIVWIQKFRHQRAFRVVMSFQPAGTKKSTIEFGDKYTYRGCPGGRKYNFSIRFGEDAAERCLQEIKIFVEKVAMPWFEQQAAQNSDG